MDNPAVIAIAAGLIFTSGFGLGYALRAIISARRRSYAREHRFSNQPADHAAGRHHTGERLIIAIWIKLCLVSGS